MNATTLIQSRHSLHLERLRKINARQNAGEAAEGFAPLDEEATAAAAVVDELEHIAGVLGIELGERRGG